MFRNKISFLGVFFLVFAALVLLAGPVAAASDDTKSDGLNTEDSYNDQEDEEPAYMIGDPIKPWNEMMFTFNDKLYFYLLKPAAQGYAYVVPQELRGYVYNFFNNLNAPVRIANSLLQGSPQKAGSELTALIINSTVGLGGFGNPASDFPELVKGDEDMGQTFAVYGIGNGFYIIWPFFGPSTLRDSFGMAGDFFLSPLTYVKDWKISAGLFGLKTINNVSLTIGDYEALKNAAFDPYIAFKDAYLQNRIKRIKE